MKTISKQIEKLEKEIEALTCKMDMWNDKVKLNLEYIEDLIEKINQAERNTKRYNKGYIQVYNQVQDKIRQIKDLVSNYNG